MECAADRGSSPGASPTPPRHFGAVPQPSILPPPPPLFLLLFTHVMFQHVNFHLTAPATFFPRQI